MYVRRGFSFGLHRHESCYDARQQTIRLPISRLMIYTKGIRLVVGRYSGDA
jgi:hypothetical protein